MPLHIAMGRIAEGESLSSVFDCTMGEIVRITMPADPPWRDANISFQISSDGQGFNDVFDRNGEEIVMPVVPGSAVVIAGGEWSKAFAYVKIRSGTRDNPVVQPDGSDFAFAVEVPEGWTPPAVSQSRKK
jgi:hypothetical protein